VVLGERDTRGAILRGSLLPNGGGRGSHMCGIYRSGREVERGVNENSTYVVLITISKMLGVYKIK